MMFSPEFFDRVRSECDPETLRAIEQVIEEHLQAIEEHLQAIEEPLPVIECASIDLIHFAEGFYLMSCHDCGHFDVGWWEGDADDILGRMIH